MKVKRELFFNLLVILIWTQTILLQYVRAIIMRLPIIGGYPDYVIVGIFIVTMILAFPYFRISKGDLLFLFFVTTVFMLNWIFNIEAQEYIERYMVDFVLKILPLYIVGVSLALNEKREEIIYQLYVLSMITLVANVFYRYAFGTPMSMVMSRYEGAMDIAYKLLPHCCLIAYYSVKKTNMWNVILTILAGFYLLMLGTRGAALIYLICVAVLLIMGNTSKWAIARTAILAGSLGAFISSSWYEAFILWMYHKAQQLGLSIRIFDKLLLGEVSSSSGRDVIREELMSKIAERPLFGYGICGDRAIMGGYAHNILIEFWVDFGVLFGTLMLITFGIILILGYRRADGQGEKGLILTLIFSSFCMLFLSGSYLDSKLLMFLLGLCVCSMRRGKLDTE